MALAVFITEARPNFNVLGCFFFLNTILAYLLKIYDRMKHELLYGGQSDGRT